MRLNLFFSVLQLMVLVVLTVFGSFCGAGTHHKHIIIHVPFHVKTHHHTHTIYKHIKHIDHGHDHHHHHHQEEISIPSGWEGYGGLYPFLTSAHIFSRLYKVKFKLCSECVGGGGWSSGSDYGSEGDLGGSYDGGYDSGSYENNNFGSSGWEDK